MRLQFGEERLRATIVDSRRRPRHTIDRVFRDALNLEHQRRAHEQRIAVSALVFARKNTNKLASIVLGVPALERFWRTNLHTVVSGRARLLDDAARTHVVENKVAGGCRLVPAWLAMDDKCAFERHA